MFVAVWFSNFLLGSLGVFLSKWRDIFLAEWPLKSGISSISTLSTATAICFFYTLKHLSFKKTPGKKGNHSFHRQSHVFPGDFPVSFF